MALPTPSKLVELEAFLKNHPQVTYVTPTSQDYASLRATYNLSNPAVPLAIVRPQHAADIASLVSHATATQTPFVVRAGGNNLFGLSQVQDALTIDLRDISYIHIDDKKETARIGGGVIFENLVKTLEKEGLVTPVGTVPWVGYSGWAMYGGYGPFSGNYGLGVDQIVGAKVVNSKGDIVDADEKMLKGIRGAGGRMGVIGELTIKVYPLKSVSGFLDRDNGKVIDFNRFLLEL
jgi:FAD/FMN-containing dehydrogenase